MADKRFEMILDLAVSMKANKADAEQAAQAIEQILDSHDLGVELGVDLGAAKEAFRTFNQLINLSSEDLAELRKSFGNIELNVDSNNVDKVIKELLDGVTDLENIDLDKLEQAFKSLSAEEMATLGEEFKRAFENLDVEKLNREIKKSASEFDSLKNKAVESYQDQLRAAQKLVLEGKENTEEYKKSIVELKKRRTELDQIEDAEKKIGQAIEATNKAPRNFVEFAAKINILDQIGQSFGIVAEAGINYEASLDAVGAVTGLAGEKLDVLGEKARALARDFGGSATQQLASFQGILSKLGPEVANDADALELIARNVNTLSAASGDDAAKSMAALTDALLQMGLASGTPMEIAENSTKVMNSLAASAQVGAAEIPQVAEAFLQVGSTAKALNIDVDKTNALLQTLAVGGKVGSEGGIALRNSLLIMASATGPAEEALKSIGTGSKELGQLLSEGKVDEALMKMKTGLEKLSDAEKVSTLKNIFGAENVAAGSILLDNIDKYKQFLSGIQAGSEGLGAAVEQANQRMDNSATNISRIKAIVEDVFISIGQFTGQLGTTVIGALTQLSPILMGFASLQTIIPEGSVGRMKDYARTITNNLIPGLIKQTQAQQGATAAQYKFNLAALNNPYFISFAALIAAVVALKMLADALNVTTEEQIKESEASVKVIDKQKEVNASRQRQIKSNKDLIASFDELNNKTNRTTEEDNRLREMKLKLGKTYPDLISKTNSFTTNLDLVRQKAKDGGTELRKLSEDMSSLSTAQIELKVKIQSLQAKKAQEEFIKEFADSKGSASIWQDTGEYLGDLLTFGIYSGVQSAAGKQTGTTKLIDMVVGWFGGKTIGEKQAEDALKPFMDGMEKATNPEQLQEAGARLKMAIFNSSDLSDTEKDKLIEKAENYVRERGEAMTAEQNKQNTKLQTAISDAFKYDSVGNLNMENIAKTLGMPVEKVSKELMSQATKAIDAGGDQKKIFEEVAKVLHKSPEEVQVLIAAQKMSIAEGKKQEEQAKSIGIQWAEARKKAQDALSKNTTELAGYIKKGLSNLSSEEKKTFDQLLADSRAMNKQLKADASAEERAKILTGELVKQGKSKYEIATALFNLREKEYNNELNSFELIQKENLIIQGRESTLADEIYLAEKKLDTQKQITKAFQEEFDKRKLIIQNEDGTFTIAPNLKIKDEERASLLDQITKINTDLKSSNLDVLALRMKVTADAKELEQQLEDIDIQNLELKISLGIDDKDTIDKLKSIYGKRLEVIGQSLEENNQKLIALNEKMNAELNSAGGFNQDAVRQKYQAELNEINRKNIELLNSQRDNNDKLTTVMNDYYTSQLTRVDDYYTDRLAILDEKFNKEKEKTEKSISSFQAAFDNATQSNLDEDLANLQSASDAKLAQLDRLKEFELISEQEYEDRKTAIQEQANKDRLAKEEDARREKIRMEGMLQGMAIEKEREANLQRAELQRDQARKELAILDEKRIAQGFKLSDEDQKKYDGLYKQFETAESIIKQSNDRLTQYLSIAGEGISEALTDLFAGDEKAAGDAMRKTFSTLFGVMSEGLRKYLEGLILELIFGEVSKLAPTGLAALVAVPAIKMIFSGFFNSLLNPVLNDLASFSTGGRVDDPTVALIGDASKLGGQNREWITSDDQLKQIVAMGANSANVDLVREMRDLKALLASQTLETRLSGEDIYISSKRVAMRRNQRKI